jgi:hypothetical protein
MPAHVIIDNPSERLADHINRALQMEQVPIPRIICSEWLL